ncbi:MAG: transcription termination factor NusA [Planctomycetota bacterium]|nr:transcription termination factor NusA [Planctomycetota bacterium]
MNPNEVLRIVDALYREKNIDPEIVFQAIEAAYASAVRRQYGEEAEITITVNREDGALAGEVDGTTLDLDEIGRIGAQTAKQVIIQKIREAERDSLIEEFQEQIDQMVSGVIQRSEGGATTVSLGNVEAILPRSEQIPGETHHVNERVRAVVIEVRPQGSRVKVVLSRTHIRLVQRLFETEIPEIVDGVISINALAREPGYRSKVAVSSSDQRVDCVGACVGVRGNRIKNIVDELAGERIDIVRWNDDPEVLIPNALQPAEVDQVLLCDMIGRAIVLVREDQLSLAIGRRGQNVRLGSKLSGWDIEIMTAEELEEQIERAVAGFSIIEGVSEELAQALVEQGYLSYDDLSVMEPDALMEMGALEASVVDAIIQEAEVKAEEAEQAATEQRRRRREQEQERLAVEAASKAEASDAGEAEASDAGEAETADAGEAEESGAKTADNSEVAEGQSAEHVATEDEDSQE